MGLLSMEMENLFGEECIVVEKSCEVSWSKRKRVKVLDVGKPLCLWNSGGQNAPWNMVHVMG